MDLARALTAGYKMLLRLILEAFNGPTEINSSSIILLSLSKNKA
jgi:hypothetical protein